MRARWQALPERQRARSRSVVELLLAILLLFVDHSLGYAVVVICALYWMRRAPAASVAARRAAVVVLVFCGSRPGDSLAVTLAIAFAIFWIPKRYRRWAMPTIALVLDGPLSVLPAEHVHDPGLRRSPDVATGVYMIVFVMMAVGLNIVVGYAGLLDLGYVAFYATGAYTAAWFASLQFPGQKCTNPTSARLPGIVPKHFAGGSASTSRTLGLLLLTRRRRSRRSSGS